MTVVASHISRKTLTRLNHDDMNMAAMMTTMMIKMMMKLVVMMFAMIMMMMSLAAGHFQEGSSDTEWEGMRQSVSVTTTTAFLNIKSPPPPTLSL